MSSPGAGLPPPLASAPSRPALIAHGSGNSPTHTRQALAAGAAFLEVDLWVHGGRFEARHERRLPGPVPFLFERWYLAPAPRRPYRLDDLLLACQGRAGVLLDLKNGAGEAPVLLREALAGPGRGVRVVASSQNWELLREVKVACPTLDLYYSVDTPTQLDLFRSVLAHDPLAAGISCRHSLLSGSTVAGLHESGLAVVAWTVDDGARAQTLAGWGVDAITTNEVAWLRAALAPPP